ncbi:MAG: YtxH domain-containing protein [Oscillospiraceae bacterium]|nr:YtxH domain-containing protein [Oscillospiraceae bacterium]
MSARSTQTMNIVKGVGIGMALGAAAGMLLKPQKKTGKRIVSDAMQAVGNLTESICDVMGW